MTTPVDWKEVAKKLPWGNDEQSKIARKALFRVFDPNGNGFNPPLTFFCTFYLL